MSVDPFATNSITCPKCGSNHLIRILENRVGKNRYRISCGHCGCISSGDSWDDVENKVKLGQVSVIETVNIRTVEIVRE